MDSNYSKTFAACNANSTDILTNLAIEIVQDCRKLNQTVDYNVAFVIIDLLTLNNKRKAASLFDRKEIQLLKQKCISILSVSPNPFSQIVKMHSAYSKGFSDKNKIIERHEDNLTQKSKPLIYDILNHQLRSKHDENKMLEKMSAIIASRYSFANPQKTEVMKDTLSALNSVISKTDLKELVKMPQKEKMDSLIRLCEVVCGILIFNRDDGHIKEILQSGYLATRNSLNQSKLDIAKTIKLWSTALKKYLPQTVDSAGNIKCVIENLVDVVIMYRQYEKLLNNLSTHLLDIKLAIDMLLKCFQEKLNTVHENLKYRVAVPTKQIFPMFLELTNLWKEMRNQLYILSEINICHEEIKTMANYNLELPSILKIDDVNEINKSEFSAQKNAKLEPLPLPDNDATTVINYSSNLKIEFNCFCAWTLAEHYGFLEPADRNIDLIKFDDKHYAFSSAEAAKKFQNQPEICLQKISSLFMDKPQLLILFDMCDDVMAITGANFKFNKHSAEITSNCSIETQTELHPESYNKQANLTFSVWKYRQQAIQFANIRKCKTISTQTDGPSKNVNPNQTHKLK